MKKIYFIIILLMNILSARHVYAQREYWGVTFAGGNTYVSTASIDSLGFGAIYKTDRFGNNQHVQYSFDSATGFRPDGMLTQALNGKLYGFASQGGTTPAGCLYEFDPVTLAYRVIKFFNFPAANYNNTSPGPNGGKPLLAANGKIYGTHMDGEVLPFPGCPQCPPVDHYYMKIFEYNPVSDVFTDVYSFPESTTIFNGTMNGTRGGPGGPCNMMQASNGKVYISFRDGAEVFGNFLTADGRLYEFIPGSNQVTLLNNYGLGTGAMPGGRMVEFSSGVLYNTFNYGTTDQMNKGGIHKYTIANNTLSIAAFVDTISGAYISGTLVKVGNKLYGTTYYGGWAPVPWTPWYERRGIIFEFNPATSVIKKVYDFAYDGSQHQTATSDFNGLSLNLLASNDTLYGITQYTMFQFNTSTGEFKNLASFTGPNGLSPQIGTGLIQTCTKPYNIGFANDTIINIQPGNAFSFIVHTTNTQTFQWQKNGSVYPDTDSILHFNAFSIADTGRYSCQLSNECGTIITKTVYLKICTLPAIPSSITPTANLSVCRGNRTILTATGTGTLSWYSAATAGIYLGTGNTFTTPVLTTSTSFYVQDSTCAASGSRRAITVVVRQPSVATITRTACSSFSINGQTYTQSGTYTQLLSNAAGCDSALTLLLQINTPVSASQNITLCAGQSLTVGNHIYSNSGTYNDILTAVNGCDSNLTSILFVQEPIDAGTIQNGMSIKANKNTARYQWIDCSKNNLPISGEMSQTFTPLNNGSYAVIVSEGICSDTSACINISKPENNISIFPNPNTGRFNILILNLTGNIDIAIYNSVGVMVSKQTNVQAITNVDISRFPAGVYLVSIIGNNKILSTTKVNKL